MLREKLPQTLFVVEAFGADDELPVYQILDNLLACWAVRVPLSFQQQSCQLCHSQLHSHTDSSNHAKLASAL